MHRSLTSLSAALAISFNLKGVSDSGKSVGAAQFFLDGLKLWRKDLHHCPAFHAYQMIVVLMPEYMLIVGMFIFPLNLINQTALHEKGECSVDGSLGDLDLFFPHGGEELFGIEMTMTGEDLRENSLPLLGELQAFPGEKFPENRLFHKCILMERGRRIQI